MSTVGSAAFFGHAGATAAMVLSSVGAAYGTAKAGGAIAAAGAVKPAIVMVALVPVIMAGLLSIYGLIVAIFVAFSLDENKPYSYAAGAMHLTAGLCGGLACLASGAAIGVAGDAGVRGLLKQPRLLVGFVLILIFSEVIGLYGLIMAVLLCMRASSAVSG